MPCARPAVLVSYVVLSHASGEGRQPGGSVPRVPVCHGSPANVAVRGFLTPARTQQPGGLRDFTADHRKVATGHRKFSAHHPPWRLSCADLG
jgi:hypothetical protein